MKVNGSVVCLLLLAYFDCFNFVFVVYCLNCSISLTKWFFGYFLWLVRIIFLFVNSFLRLSQYLSLDVDI